MINSIILTISLSSENSLQSESNDDIRGIKLTVLDEKKPCSTEAKFYTILQGKTVLPTVHGYSHCSALLHQDRSCIGLL